MARWSSPAGWARVAGHHRRREAQARAAGDVALADEAARTAATFEALLDHQSRCRRCGRPLTDPTSVEAGIGPECARQTGPGEALPAPLSASHGPEAPITPRPGRDA